MAAIFVQATFPGIAGIYYGDEIGLNGSNEPSNREAFPWQDEKGWDEDLLSWTTQLMNLKSNNETKKITTAIKFRIVAILFVFDFL